jgi:hypothetical protein
VGRDVLVGCVFGVAVVSSFFLTYPIASWVGVPQEQPFVGPLRLLLGSRSVVAVAFWSVVSPVFFALAMLFILVLLRLLLRREWAAVALFVLILTAGEVLRSASPLLYGIADVLAYGATVWVVARFGLLALVVALQVTTILQWFPITTDLSAWYAGIGLTGVCLLLGLTFYGFYTSLGGQPLFGRASLED